MPSDCEVVLGAHSSEPDPLPDGYYEGHTLGSMEYENETCSANTESGQDFSYPGTIFPYSPAADQSTRTPYVVPVRTDVASVLSAEPITCGLPSDPPSD